MDDRYCERCGERLRRKKYGKRLESLADFKRRRFCNSQCANNRDKKPEKCIGTGDVAQEENTPLQYLLKVMNDPGEDTTVRVNAARIAAPFVHKKPGDKGKKAERDDAAKKAGGGRFGAMSAPKVVNIKKQ